MYPNIGRMYWDVLQDVLDVNTSNTSSNTSDVSKTGRMYWNVLKDVSDPSEQMVRANGQIKCLTRAADSCCFFRIWPSERFQSWMVLFDLLLFQFLGSQFLGIVSWMSELVALRSFYLQQSFYCGFQWTTGHLVMSYHPLGSRLRLMLGLMDVLLRFGFSGRANWIWPLGLISDGSDSAALLLWLLLRTFLGETSVSNGFIWSVVISAPSSLFLGARMENSDSAQFNSLFSAKFWLRIPRDNEIDSLVLSFFGFAAEAVVEVGESSARVWAFGTPVGLAGSGIY